MLPYKSSYLSLYFSIRYHALASLVSALAQIAGTAALGTFLDWKRLSLNARARVSFAVIMALIGGCWVWGAVIQAGYARRKPSLDWNEPGLGAGQLRAHLQLRVLVGGLDVEAFRRRREIHKCREGARERGAAHQFWNQFNRRTRELPPPSLTAALGANFGLWGVAVNKSVSFTSASMHRRILSVRTKTGRREDESRQRRPVRVNIAINRCNR
ncbi:hypothetical protein LZ31DRAFT_590855 [Colletotrichum somersetense]|nr:hypothetical protein LZ31DRAFT_590855 [Colletotrichum somersetense]